MPRLDLTCYALKYSVAHNIQWPRPLRSNTERRNVAKKMNFSQVEIDTVTPEIEFKKKVIFWSLKMGIKGVNKNIKMLYGRRSRRQLKSPAVLRCYATDRQKYAIYWLQSFQSFNGEILKMFHGTQYIPLQIMKRSTYGQILPLLRNDALRNAVPECIQLFSNLTGRKRLKQFEKVSNQLVTLSLHYSRKLSSEETLVMREQLSVTTDTVVKIFGRLLVKGELYYSQEFTRVVKRNSLTVLLQNGPIINAYYYILKELHGDRKCFAFGRKYDRSHNTLVNVENVVGLKRKF